VYGLRFRGFPESVATMMGDPQDDDPLVEVSVDRVDRRLDRPADEVVVDADQARLRMEEGWMDVDRRPSYRLRFRLEADLRAETLVHPYLSFPAAVLNGWLGRVVLHAGAIVCPPSPGAAAGGPPAPRAVAVLGAAGSGKSSTMAGAARAGIEVLADDLLVIDGRVAHAGPRAADVRPDIASLFDARPLGVVGARERWRVDLPSCRPAAPLGALALLAWGPTLAATPVRGTARMAALLDAAALARGWMPSVGPMALLDVPMWQVERPRELAALPEVLSLLEGLVPRPL
jgi:hypothetical protein